MQKFKFLIAVPYLLVILAVFLALNPLWLQDFPALNLYSGGLSFSGVRAYADLHNLVTRFPNRVAGTPSGRASADWMAEVFKGIGLETRLEEFETFVPESIWDTGFLFQPMVTSHKQFTGTNVVAVSRGKSTSVVLLMAHRDVVKGTVQGAGDNGSGNAALIELARVLTASEHFYTYMFVSTDAEESGKQGAHWLAASHPELNMQMVIALDDVAYANAQTVGLYNSGNARQSTPLWTVALAHQVLRVQGLNSEYLNSYYYWNENPDQVTAVKLLQSLLSQRGLGTRSATDSEVFLERGDPALGFEAVRLRSISTIRPLSSLFGPGYEPLGATHTPQDSMEQMSAASMEMSGRFVEQYVRSLELNNFDGLLKGRLYVLWLGRYLPACSVLAFTGLLLSAFALLVILPFVAPLVEPRTFLTQVRRDLPWVGKITLIALAAGLVWQLPRLSIFRLLPPIVFLAFSALLVIAGGVWVLRGRLDGLRLWHFEPTVANQRRFLALLLFGFFLAYSLLFSPFTAAAMLFLPFLVWSVAQFRSVPIKRLYLAVFGLWTVLHALFSVLILYTAANRVPPWGPVGMATCFLNAGLWLAVLVFVFSTPPLGGWGEGEGG